MHAFVRARVGRCGGVIARLMCRVYGGKANKLVRPGVRFTLREGRVSGSRVNAYTKVLGARD